MSETSEPSMSRARRIAVMFALIVAGEAVFGLPFVLPRVFRPTLLDVFGLTNLELGAAFSVYGVVAMIAYVFGGPLADRFSARRLMSVALLATGAGGLVLARIPDPRTLALLYGWWGLTSILLFWAPLIRATREWGGADEQGRAYGILDSGRGLLGAVLGLVAVVGFAALLPEVVESASAEQRRAAFIHVIELFTALTMLGGVVVWFVLPERAPGRAQAQTSEGEPAAESAAVSRSSIADLGVVLRMPAVWLQALIVICAYVGYKSTDDLSLYARDAFGYDEVAAARVGALGLWVRPVAAIAVGLIADRISASRATMLGFAVMSAASFALALGLARPGLLLLVDVVVVCAGVFGLRGAYFALFAEGRVPLAYMGSAVGVVSLLGFTPDVFMGPIMGVLIDGSPGATGHQQLFGLVALVGVVGIVCTALFRRVASRAPA